MKKLKNINLLIIPFAIFLTSFLLAILKDEVPMKFLSDGTIKDFGSKYEYLLFPGIVILLVNIMNYLAKGFKDNEKYKNITYLISIVLNVGVIGLTVGIILNVILLNKFEYVQVNVIQLISVFVSLIVFVLGLFVIEKNGNNIICLKNKYSMYNMVTYNKTQRSFGTILLISSAILVVLATLVKGLPLIYLECVIFASIYIVSNIASYKCYLNAKKSEENDL